MPLAVQMPHRNTPSRKAWQGKSCRKSPDILTLLARFTTLGASVIFVNYFGDWGFQKALLIVLPSGSFLKQKRPRWLV
jgi:hypothetical protein